MGSKMRLLNVKVPDELRALIELAVEVSDSPDLSKWSREALEAAARAEIANHERITAASNHPPDSRTVAHVEVLRIRSTPGQCVHPSTARRQQVEAEVCGLCGVVTRWKV